LSEREFFSDAWWDAVLGAWNAADHARLFAGAGTLQFQLEGESPHTAWVNWDENGHGTRVSAREPFAPLFRATEQQWREFVSGRIDAKRAVLTGKLRFSGSLPRILPYVRAFDALAAVARGSA